MRLRKFKVHSADFETTTYTGQDHTEVWASATVELFTEQVELFHSIGELYQYYESMRCDIISYFHNLKFDGSFWLPFLMQELRYKQAYEKTGSEWNELTWLKEKDMPKCSFKYSISDQGQWYTIIIKTRYNRIIEIRDSLKLLPFSVKEIGKSFGTRHKKLDMEYKGYRYAGCSITEREQEYIKNDVLVVKEALEIMYNDGHTGLTIGSCCLKEWKRMIGKDDYDTFFPDVYSMEIDKDIYGTPTVGHYCHKSYKGGWCYGVEEKLGKVHKNGVTADVNSLYPFVMHSDSGNRYPVGKPTFWSGDYIPDEACRFPNRYYFVRIRTRFYLKPGFLPFIQVKGNLLYKSTECLRTSDIYNSNTGNYYPEYKDRYGNRVQALVTLTLTMTDFHLIQKHYDLVDCQILDGCWFYSEIGLFDTYIDKYKKIKMEGKGAVRTEAKLFSNNLYGKIATSANSSFKVAYEKENGVIGFFPVHEENKSTVYIPAGSAITSYARCYTITHAQRHFHGADKPGFIYADTDSNHFDLPPDVIRKDFFIDDKIYGAWKLESYWDYGIFTRQKTYIEHVTHEDGEPVAPYFNVKCAGMPDRCKQNYLAEYLETPENDLIDQEQLTECVLKNFKPGLRVPGKLMPVRIKGGIVLKDTDYEMQ